MPVYKLMGGLKQRWMRRISKGFCTSFESDNVVSLEGCTKSLMMPCKKIWTSILGLKAVYLEWLIPAELSLLQNLKFQQEDCCKVGCKPYGILIHQLFNRDIFYILQAFLHYLAERFWAVLLESRIMSIKEKGLLMDVPHINNFKCQNGRFWKSLQPSFRIWRPYNEHLDKRSTSYST